MKPTRYGFRREPKTLDDRIRNRRMTVGLRQQDLATTLRVNRDTLRNWGANRVLPVARYITAIDDFPSGQAY